MARKIARYAVVDAFTDTPFKGNPAAVCFLEEGEEVDDDWMQAVAKEFNLSETAFLKRFTAAGPPASNSTCFHLRWFTPIAEVELSSGEDVTNLKPNFDELCKCAGSGVIVTAIAPPGSGFDFYSRFFCPKFGINEDPVTGSAHCLLAPYWSKKLGKQNLMAYQASPRGGILKLQLDEQNQRVLISGEAVTVMTGTLFA